MVTRKGDDVKGVVFAVNGLEKGLVTEPRYFGVVDGDLGSLLSAAGHGSRPLGCGHTWLVDQHVINAASQALNSCLGVVVQGLGGG